ncbi:hypothetical protein PAHAL_7G283000 [Panicum hallii]|jgi:hypothetical protein|uniref:Uncharacterized protein n=1 Tax=Panicum hallii TaxID=206008 RepID=A0A2T8IDT1_9POAL|nr:hypothetical protein PAHAL_7G283000 [Panicum hallii]
MEIVLALPAIEAEGAASDGQWAANWTSSCSSKRRLKFRPPLIPCSSSPIGQGSTCRSSKKISRQPYDLQCSIFSNYNAHSVLKHGIYQFRTDE